MSTIQEQLNALLLVASPNGAFPMVAPGESTFPYVVYQRVANGIENTLSGNGSPPVNSTRFQIASWGRTYASAVAQSAAITSAMLGWSVQNIKVHEHDEYEPDAKAFRIIQDYSVWSPGNT